MIAALALALLLQGPAGQGDGAVQGRIRSEDGSLLEGVVVRVETGRGTRVDHTGRDGAYRIRGLPPGRHILAAARPDHHPAAIEVIVSAGSAVSVDLTLQPRPIPTPELRVRGGLPRSPPDSAMVPALARKLVATRALESSSGIPEISAGTSRGGAPGVTPIDPGNVLYVRGSPSDLKLLLLDGAPVYTPFHVGGLLEAFDPGLLGEATLYAGGAPARYDGGLSYVLELHTRPGREGVFRGTGAVDPVSARATLEGTLGGAVRILGGVRTVSGSGVNSVRPGTLPYAYADGLVRLDAALGETGVLAVTGFTNREAVELGGAEGTSGPEWGNTALSTRLRGALGGTRAEATVAWSRFGAALPGDTTTPAAGVTERLRATADLARTVHGVAVHYGASLDRVEIRHGYADAPPHAPGTGRSERGSGDVLAGYAEGLLRAHERLVLRGGVRASSFSVGPGLRFSPRLSATWLASDRLTLTLAGGRYHQLVRHETLESSPVSSAGPARPGLQLDVGSASHLTLGMQQELESDARMGLETFYKEFSGTAGARASGVDLWALRDVGRLQGWIGYSLSWTWSLPGEQATTPRFAGRQVLSAGAGARWGETGRADLRLSYASGLPFSAIPLDPTATYGLRWSPIPEVLVGDEPRASAPPPDRYLRLDLRASKAFTVALLGRETRLEPYARVLNALDRRDALFYVRRNGAQGVRPVAPLQLLPLAGLEWSF